MTPLVIPVDFEALDAAHGRLERALELVTTIRDAGRELAELVTTDSADGTIVAALEPAQAAEHVRPVADDPPAAPAPPPSPPRPDPSPAAPPTADDGPPAAAPAPQPSTPPAPAPADASDRPGHANRRRGERARALILEHMRALPAGTELAAREIRAILNGFELGANTPRALRALLAAGALEHNGGQRNAARYRLASTTVDPAEQAGSTAPPAGVPAAPDTAPALEPPASSPSPAAEGARPRPADDGRNYSGLRGPAPASVSRRVARELEREALEAAAEKNRNGADPRAGTLEGRIMAALVAAPACGIRELAKRLGMTVPTEELVTTVSVLARHGDVRVALNPRRTEIGQETKLIEAIA